MPCAVKMLHPFLLTKENTNALHLIEKEVELLARCMHPNITSLLAANFVPPQLCIVTELMVRAGRSQHE